MEGSKEDKKEEEKVEKQATGDSAPATQAPSIPPS